MRLKLALALFLCLPLPACNGFAAGPVEVADQTVIDEKTAIGFELAYTAASKSGLTLARAGIIDAGEFAALDRRAYTALLAVRATYRSGNAAGFDTAAAELQAAIETMTAALEKRP